MGSNLILYLPDHRPYLLFLWLMNIPRIRARIYQLYRSLGKHDRERGYLPEYKTTHVPTIAHHAMRVGYRHGYYHS